MTRRFAGGSLVIATHNPGKAREIAELLALFAAEVTTAGALGLDEPEETGATFAENARIKALAAAKDSGLPALADDSGLEVRALGGRPGVRSARLACPAKDFALAMRQIEDKLKGSLDRSANFICALALAWPDGYCETFEGRVDGVLVWPPRGTRGFGYDPVFVAHGHALTFGEMAPEDKHALSHRACAFRKLVAACFEPAL